MPDCCRPDSALGLPPDTTFRVGGGVTPVMALGAILLLWLTFTSVKAYW